MGYDTIAHKVLANGRTMGSRPAHRVKSDGTWEAIDWATYADEVRASAKALIALGVEPGTPVNILGFNRPEWVVMHVGAIAAGAVPAGIYTTSSPLECLYIIGHCESPVVLVENAEQWAKIERVRAELPLLRHVVTMKGADPVDDEMVLTWEEFLAAGADVPDSDVETRLDAAEADGLATLIYTSGTTGPPKGVMLSHENVTWTPLQIVPAFGLNRDDRFFSYLPLSHIAEQSFTISAPASVGAEVWFAESIEKVPENLKEVKPTVFFAVPRVWERFHAGVTRELGKSTGIKHKIGAWAMGVGRKVSALRNAGKPIPAALAAQYQVASALVFKKVKAALGLSEVRIASSGAAPVSPEILEFFSGLDIIVYEVYGQSEGSGPTTYNLPGKAKLGTVGPPFPNVEVRIAEDGEILLKGKNVFLGYYKDPESTAETLVDGWLHSGDVGEFDDAGFLHITGRKKEILITAGGKNVAPIPIEAALKAHPLITEAIVIGDRRRFLSALITVDPEAAAAFMAEHGESGDAAHESPAVEAAVQAAVDDVNEDYARVEQLKRFTILSRPLSIEGGELTPTLKVKRAKVNEHFADVIESMYTE